ncbi:MAG: tagaturonate reductase [Thermosediminibacterales bacterium]|nr:tagaturonate reductase [Thermosediminibacterales bacterium]MDK2836524.1 tagaturonate reductase [Thermosediminibacterales bacterium]
MLLKRELIQQGKIDEKLVSFKGEGLTEKVIQFGEGNFLRAFVEWMFHEMNKKGLFNGKVVAVQPIPFGRTKEINEQDGLYTLILRGIQQGQVIEKKEIITSLSRCINPYENYDELLKCAENPEIRYMISNTTEAGIAYDKEDSFENTPPKSFPGKVTAYLYHRFKHFNGAPDKGMVIIPCELIDRNGDRLKEIVLKLIQDWNLPGEFKEWVEQNCKFLNTLVDRIVTGYSEKDVEKIQKEYGYQDKNLDTGEIFHLWVIEGDEKLKEELPFHKAGLNVIWTDDMTPYRTRKVRILNGAHTMTVPTGFLYGIDTVKEAVEHPVIGKYMEKGIYEEIIPSLDLAEKDMLKFADDVVERFKNPFIKHYLIDISLNSTSKFKTRVLPSIIEYVKRKGQLPKILTFSLAALIAFYRGTAIKDGKLTAERNGEKYEIRDNMEALEFFKNLWDREVKNEEDFKAIVDEVLSHEKFCGQDLREIEGINAAVAAYLKQIIEKGMKESVEKLIEE